MHSKDIFREPAATIERKSSNVQRKWLVRREKVWQALPLAWAS
jgi:hypothetical protein